ncbi:MAG: hypothetical protein R6U69_12140 [Marinobacter sp.]|uniref:hypothetical protein n=1 Tax=Marinobacter sp. TaxID=50741 RepID=UPI003976640F
MRFSPQTTVVSTALTAVLAAVAVLGVFTSAGSVQSTQVVPLEFAHQRGAYAWPDETVQALIKDPDNTILLSQTDINERKGRGPLEWLPPSAQCQYIGRFMTLIKRYGLETDPGEMTTLAASRQRCATQFQ